MSGGITTVRADGSIRQADSAPRFVRYIRRHGTGTGQTRRDRRVKARTRRLLLARWPGGVR